MCAAHFLPNHRPQEVDSGKVHPNARDTSLNRLKQSKQQQLDEVSYSPPVSRRTGITPFHNDKNFSRLTISTKTSNIRRWAAGKLLRIKHWTYSAAESLTCVGYGSCAIQVNRWTETAGLNARARSQLTHVRAAWVERRSYNSVACILVFTRSSGWNATVVITPLVAPAVKATNTPCW